MKMPEYNCIKILSASALLCFLIFSQAGAAGTSPGVFLDDNETVYYPPEWKISPPRGDVPSTRAGLTFYYRYSRNDARRPIHSGGWASIEVLNRTCLLCGNSGIKAVITDYVADKQCKVPKCLVERCQVHGDGTVPRNRLTKHCVRTLGEPRLTGRDCGEYFKRDKVKDIFYYYFREMPAAPGSNEKVDGVMVIFQKGGYIYTAQLICPEGDYKKYRPVLEYIATNLKVTKPIKTKTAP